MKRIALAVMALAALSTSCPVLAGDVDDELVHQIDAEFVRTNNATAALAALGTILQKYPNNVAAHMLAGRIQEQCGFGGLADESFSEADKLNPQQPVNILDEFRVKLANEGPLKAQYYLRYVQHRFPNNPDVLRLAGFLEQLRGNAVFAEYYYKQAIKKNPNVAGLRSKLASFYLSQKRFDEAKAELDADFKLLPNNAASSLVMGQLLLAEGKPEAAVPYLERCYSVKGVDRSEIASLLAKTYSAIGKYSQALQPTCLALALVSDKDAKKVNLYKIMELNLLKRVPVGELVNTVHMVAGSSDLTSPKQRAMLILGTGDVLDIAGYKEEARNLFVKGLQVLAKAGATNYRPFIRIGDIYWRDGQYSQAQQMYNLAYSTNGTSSDARAKVERVDQRAGNRKRDVAWKMKDALEGKAKNQVTVQRAG